MRHLTRRHPRPLWRAEMLEGLGTDDVLSLPSPRYICVPQFSGRGNRRPAVGRVVWTASPVFDSDQNLVSEEFFERVARPGFPSGLGPGRHEVTPSQIKKLAVVCHVFFGHRVGPRIAALLCHVGVIADAVQTHFQIRTALVAAFRPARIAGQLVFLAALPTMSCHCHAPNIRSRRTV